MALEDTAHRLETLQALAAQDSPRAAKVHAMLRDLVRVVESLAHNAQAWDEASQPLARNAHGMALPTTRRAAGETRARAEQRTDAAASTLLARSDSRRHAVAQLQGFAATSLLATAMPDVDIPPLQPTWAIERAPSTHWLA